MKSLEQTIAELEQELLHLRQAGEDHAQLSRRRALDIAEELLGYVKMLITTEVG